MNILIGHNLGREIVPYLGRVSYSAKQRLAICSVLETRFEKCSPQSVALANSSPVNRVNPSEHPEGTSVGANRPRVMFVARRVGFLLWLPQNPYCSALPSANQKHSALKGCKVSIDASSLKNVMGLWERRH